MTLLLVVSIGQAGVFSMFMIVLLLTALVVWLLAEETRGRSLEELSERPAPQAASG